MVAVKHLSSSQAGAIKVANPLAPRSNKPAPTAEAWRGAMAEDAEFEGVASETFLCAANATLEKWEFSHGTGIPNKINVLEPPPKVAGQRILDLSVIMSVSGHTGMEDQFAKSNTYAIRVTLPDGTVHKMENIQRAEDIEYATMQNISFPLQKGVTVVEGWPEGSLGVGGYKEARRHEIHFGQTFVPKKTSGKDQAYLIQDWPEFDD